MYKYICIFLLTVCVWITAFFLTTREVNEQTVSIVSHFFSFFLLILYIISFKWESRLQD